MPLYEFTCKCGTRELVRPLGTESVPCVVCDTEAIRWRIYRFGGMLPPSTDVIGLHRRFVEAAAEREDVYRKIERETGETPERPDDWGPAHSRAHARLQAGELDKKAVQRDMEHETYVDRRRRR